MDPDSKSVKKGKRFNCNTVFKKDLVSGKAMRFSTSGQ